MDFTSWWTWANSYEPTLAAIDINPVPAIINDAYNESLDSLKQFNKYMTCNSFNLLVYRLALHLLIIHSRNTAIPQLNSLYKNYDIARASGVIQSASDGPSSATRVVPNGLQNGDARTILLWATPYGQEVEATYEELKSIAIFA